MFQPSFSATEAAKPLAFSQSLKRGANRLPSRAVRVMGLMLFAARL